MSSDDEIMGQPVGGPAVLPPDVGSSDDEIMCGAPQERVVRRRVRLPKPAPPTAGSFWTLALTKVLDGESYGVFGVVELSWDLQFPTGDVDERDCGTLVYKAGNLHSVPTGAAILHGIDFASSLVGLHVLGAVGQTLLDNGQTIASHLHGEGADSTNLLFCSDAEAEALLSGPHVFRTVAIRKRSKPLGVLFDTPNPATLRRWREKVRDEGAIEANPADAVLAVSVAPGDPMLVPGPLLHLPERFLERSDTPSMPMRSRVRNRAEIDPVKLVTALGVARHLRSVKSFTEVVDDAYDYLFLDAPERLALQRSDPSYSTIYRSLARADAVSMLLFRRQLQQWRADGVVRSMNMYNDASPVTGAELAGILVDINFKDGTQERVVLPGSTLAYGHTDTISKGSAMLWAIWLIAGPSTDDVLWFCAQVRSLTTDFGVEMHLLEMPDIAAAMVAWAGGTPLRRVVPIINQDRRLFAMALRIGGWSHTLGNIMKAVANEFIRWPRFLGNMRSLCKFFKNDSYRLHIKRNARRIGLPANEKALLRSFNASFAKWRYETVVEALSQLLARRAICGLITNDLFLHVQDKEELKAVLAACADREFWDWAATSHPELFKELETLRRWGMVCDCEAHLEERRLASGKLFIKCPRTV